LFPEEPLQMQTRKGEVSAQALAPLIFTIRGHRVILDAGLARLYGVTTKRLNEALKRNQRRFPDDFAFRLTPVELATLRSRIADSSGPRADSSGKHPNWSQFATSSSRHRGATTGVVALQAGAGVN